MYTFIIPYNSIHAAHLSKQAVTAVYHSAMWEAGKQRIIQTVLSEFATISSYRRDFLHNVIYSSIVNADETCKSAYLITFSVIGRPDVTLRNLAHTLQDPADRQVYVICLNEAHGAGCWEFVGITALLCMLVCIMLIGPTAMMTFYEPPHH